MTRASGTTRGSAVSKPGTSFHRHTRLAPRARPINVAVRSVPPRPRVATAGAAAPSSRRAPRNPGTIGTTPAASSGRSRRRARASVCSRLGAAPPKGPSVATTSRASTTSAARPCSRRTAQNMGADSRSPRDTTRSLVRGVSSRSTTRPLARSSSSRSEASIWAVTSSRSLARSPSAPTMALYLSRSALTAALIFASSPWRALSATSSSRSVTPDGAEQTTTTGEAQRFTISAALRNADASPSDAPPNL